jgi:carbamoyltransferase
VIDYCLEAEGITLDDVDLVGAQLLHPAGPEMEERLVYFDAPGFLPEFERGDAAKHPLYLSHRDKVVTISHHWRTPTARSRVSPFERAS